ncbi:hypothetical protein ACQKKK_17130 [Peribacillus sp. NPDC006672]|uniref:hypothetical protein n=1 Tax=Peribacillus sp. NPDC006672 TaxID=3390606 RepID=UPI003CFF74F1
MDKKAIEQKARAMAVEYFAIEEDIKFVPEETEIHDDDIATVVVYGHNKETKEKIFASMDYTNDFKVGSTGGW